MVGEQFKLEQKIGQGSFGKVYLARDVNNYNKPVAIKTEPLNQQFSQLLREIQSYRALQGIGFPRLIKQGITTQQGAETTSLSAILNNDLVQQNL